MNERLEWMLEQSNVSQHLAVLRRENLIESRKQGTGTFVHKSTDVPVALMAISTRRWYRFKSTAISWFFTAEKLKRNFAVSKTDYEKIASAKNIEL